ncbi:MAG TPA: response regulator transcription factor [Acidimicrobiales bacterium]|nr:response regulator transcription factor [Acidimicrobiales bacterium]
MGETPVDTARGVVLTVEDEEAIAGPLASALRREGFEPVTAGTVAAALSAFDRVGPDLVLLDVMLPDGDGRDVLRELRRRSQVPVIMLTARDEPTDKVVGLELGADDYVVKPFEVAELMARVRAVLRRMRPAPATGRRLRFADLELDPASHTVTRAGAPVDLTLKEFEVLRMLLERPGEVVRRGELMDEVWDPNWYGSDKTLDVHVSSLRHKLGDDPAAPRYIQTVRGVGFRTAPRS